MAKLWKKLIVGGTIAGITATAVALPIQQAIAPVASSAIQNKKKSSDKFYYYYDNNYFDTLDDATRYALNKEQLVSHGLWVGDAQDAIFDQQSKRLDISRLRPYDTSRLNPAYLNAVNVYDYDYTNVKNSFLNPALIKYKYDDFNGNLFDSRSEAQESIRKSVRRSATAFLDYNDYYNTPTKINPLNDDDIDQLKVDTLKKFLFSHDPSFQLSIYSEVNSNDPQKHLEKGLLNKIFNDPDFLNDFILQIYKEIFSKYWVQFMNNPSNPRTFNVRISICNFASEQGKNYKFSDVQAANEGPNQNIRPVLIDKSTIEFQGVKQEQLSLFERFLDRSQFESHHNIWRKKWLDNWNAEEANNKDTDLNCKYNIYYTGDNQGWKKGVDIQILRDGTAGENYRCDFNVSADLNNKSNSKWEFKNYINENMVNIMKSFLDTYYDAAPLNPKSFEYITITKLFRATVNYILNTQYNELLPIFGDTQRTFNAYHGENIYDYQKYITNVKYLDVIGRVVIDFHNLMSRKYYIKRNIIEDIVGWDNLINFNINNAFNNSEFVYKFVLEYNNKPLWIFDNSISKYLNYKVTVNNKFGNDAFITIPLNQYNFNEFKKYITDQPTIAKKDIKKNLINVSSSFIEESTYVGGTPTKKSLIQFIKTNGQVQYQPIYKKDGDLFVDGTDPNNPSINNLPTPHKLSESLSWYNNNIKAISEKYSGKLTDDTKVCMNNRNGVLRLYDVRGDESPVYYAETLDMPSKFNASLFNTTKQIYTAEDKIAIAIKNAEIVNPAKVVVLYSLTGEVVNPGVRLNEQERLTTTNDAIYDSEQVVMSNLLRTKVILNDPTKVFYAEDNGKMTLLDNIVDEVYELNISGKKYYFANYVDAYLYLKDYVEMNSIKVRK